MFPEFLLRQQVLALYRDVQRTLRKVPDAKDRQELHKWAREEFKKNKHHTDENAYRERFEGLLAERVEKKPKYMAIKMMLTQGKRTLKELESSLNLVR